MKNASISGKKLSAMLKKIGPVSPPEFPGMAIPAPRDSIAAAGGDPIAVLVMSMLLWESTTDKALAAYDRLMERLVDFNDLRVCMPHETLELIGPRYPRALDRCQRLRAVLRNIYLREHAVKIDRLAATSKREVKKYIDSLEGIMPFAAARVLLLSFGTHVIPVDDQLRIQLIDAEVADAAVEIPELSNWLSAQIKAGDGPAAHFSLQSWIDEIAAKTSGEKKPAPKRLTGRSSSPKRDTRSSAKAAAG